MFRKVSFTLYKITYKALYRNSSGNAHLMLLAAVSSPRPWEDSTRSWNDCKTPFVHQMFCVQVPQLQEKKNKTGPSY